MVTVEDAENLGAAGGSMFHRQCGDAFTALHLLLQPSPPGRKGDHAGRKPPWPGAEMIP